MRIGLIIFNTNIISAQEMDEVHFLVIYKVYLFNRKMKKCTSCGTEVMERYTEFKCPNCGKTDIIRCRSCRVLGTAYTCDVCGWKGP